MQGKSISAVLATSFPIHTRLQEGIDKWQKLMPGPLLRAALLNTDGIGVDVQALQDNIDVNDPIQRQVLPQLHANMANHLPDGITKAIKMIRLESLVRNSTYLSELPLLACCLKQAGIQVLALKGAALAPTHYRDIGCRPLSDLDILVPEKKLQEAINILTASGWQADNLKPEKNYYAGCRFNHAFSFVHPDKLVQLDLHGHCNHSALWPDADKLFWERAVPLAQYEGVLRLCDTDNLVQVCNHGIAQNHASPVRWAMDAYHIIDDDNIDWDLLVENANRTFIAPQLLAAFIWLQQELHVAIPPHVLSELGNASYNSHGLKAWSYRLELPTGVSEILHSHWQKMMLSTKNTSMTETVRLMPEYLKTWSNQKNLLAVATAMLMKFWEIVARRRHSDKQ
ncbi:MAG: hypothetical protein ACJA09_002176 [Alcanivorax sp.]|jgi:hypothetical protein